MHIRVRDHGANVNAEDNRGRTPLYQVLEDENLFNEYRFGIAQLLIERSLAVDKQEKYHETALHLTARTMSFELACILLNHGADLNAAKKKRKRPLSSLHETI